MNHQQRQSNDSQPRLCGAYLLDALSFLSLAQVNHCRRLSTHLHTTILTLKCDGRLAVKRRYESISFELVSHSSHIPAHNYTILT